MLHNEAAFTIAKNGTFEREFMKGQKVMIHTVCKRAQAIKLKKKIKEIDPSSFMIVTISCEIIGRGFGNV